MSSRRVLSALLVLLPAGALPASAADPCIRVDFSKSPGASVVGPGAVHSALDIRLSGGNDVVAISRGGNPVAFGANTGGVNNVVNACLAQEGGFADLGSGTYSHDTRKHEYTFAFTGGATVSAFSVRMLDWGDYLPYGACPDGQCRFVLTAWTAEGKSVAEHAIVFSSASAAKTARPTEEFGSLAVAGDACEGTDGQPGNFTFRVTGKKIARVTLAAPGRSSVDPNIGFDSLCFTPEKTVIAVELDVKPGESPNRINPKSKGTFPAAILSSAKFDAADVDVASVTLAGVRVATKGSGEAHAAMEDVNGDGRADLLLHFETSGLPAGSSVLQLAGETRNGDGIVGQDSVELVR